MIEYFETARHIPDNIEGRIVVQYDLTNGVERKVPHIGHAYRVTEAKGKQLIGDPLGAAPVKKFLNITTIALVCDTEKELSQLCAAHNAMKQTQASATNKARDTIMSLAGLPTDKTEGGKTRVRTRSRQRTRT